MHISMAGDLLRQMIAELRCLQADNSSFSSAMSINIHGLSQRLDALEITTELLASAPAADTMRTLTKHAKLLIVRMVAELDHLICQAQIHHSQDSYIVGTSVDPSI
jgi:hypothetical protein